VENSVVGPPYGIAVSPDGTRAYVLRTRGSAPDGVTEVGNVFTDLPGEAVVSTVDISDPRRPVVIQQTVVGAQAHTLSLSPDGRFLAVNTDVANRNIIVLAVTPNGNLGAELTAISADPGKPVRRVGRVEWHPSGRFLAHGLPFKNEMVFYEFEQTPAGVALRPWGNPVKVGKFPDEGTFTAKGDYYLTTDLQWGDDVPGLFHDPPPGTITAVRFDPRHGRHRVTGRAGTDVSPEGIAVSPDGRFVVTGNLTSSWMPWTDERFEPGGSLNLLELDPRSGKLRTRQQVRLNGVLPEGITFDASGNHVAATVFDHYDPRYRRGSVQFLTLARDDCPNLIPTHVELEVPAGPHSVHLIR
jgi:6-phosphogluconolactonase (cycloisomerase 2 family)